MGKLAPKRPQGGTRSLPTLPEVYLKQILGPVPVFQIFCAMLWLMDEYWNYALFNMFSILMFEGSTAFGPLKNISSLRGLRNKAGNVMVYRVGKWAELSTEDLLPGDTSALATSVNMLTSIR